MSVQVKLNGEPHELPDGATLAEAVSQVTDLASGHYRNGILMSPVTADAAVALLAGQAPVPEWEPFTPQRFTGTDQSR